MLAVIGTEWVRVVDQSGHPRLADPQDLVRIEIGTALRRGIPTVPILADGALLPASQDLPPDLAILPSKLWHRIDDERFESDVTRLIELLETEYKVLPAAKERALVAVKFLCQFIGVALLASGTWLMCFEAAVAFGLAALLAASKQKTRMPT
jgi:hypothetical protein